MKLVGAAEVDFFFALLNEGTYIFPFEKTSANAFKHHWASINFFSRLNVFYSSFHTKRAWNSDCQKQSLRKWYEGIKIAEIAKTIDAKLEQETREKKLRIEYIIEFPDVYYKRLWTSLSEFYQTKHSRNSKSIINNRIFIKQFG